MILDTDATDGIADAASALAAAKGPTPGTNRNSTGTGNTSTGDGASDTHRAMSLRPFRFRVTKMACTAKQGNRGWRDPFMMQCCNGGLCFAAIIEDCRHDMLCRRAFLCDGIAEGGGKPLSLGVATKDDAQSGTIV